MNTGDLIRLRRRELGMSQSELSAVTNVSQQYVSAVENGERRLDSYPLMVAFARALRVSLDHLASVVRHEELPDEGTWEIAETASQYVAEVAGPPVSVTGGGDGEIWTARRNAVEAAIQSGHYGSARALSQKSGVSPMSICRLRNGGTLRDSTWRRLRPYVSQWYEPPEQPGDGSIDAQSRRLLAIYAALDADGQRELLKQARKLLVKQEARG